MNFKKEYIILIVIIAALSVYLVLRKSGRIRYDLPAVAYLVKDDISKLTIKKTDSDIALVRENGKWFISPQNFSADNGITGKLLDDVSDLKLTALVSESRNYSIYDLGEEKKIEVAVYKGETLLRRIDIGKVAPSFRHTFVKLGDDYRIFHASGNLRNVFDKTVSGLRDKVVMKIEDEITEIVLTRGNEEMTLVKTVEPPRVDLNEEQEGDEMESSGPIWKTGEGKAAKVNEVEDIINILSNLACDDYVEDREKKDYTSPVYTITLKGMKTYAISLFEKEDNKYSAVSSESDYPFLLSAWKTEKMMKEFVSLVSPTVESAPAPE